MSVSVSHAVWICSLLRACGPAGRQRLRGKALRGLPPLCPLLLIPPDWKQVTAHLTARILGCSCYAESSTRKHLHDSCLCGPHVAFRLHFHNPLCARGLCTL